MAANGTVTSSYTWDANGNRLSRTAASGAINGQYDAQDRLLRYGTSTYAWRDDGQLLSRAVDGQGTTLYQYDAFGRLLGVTTADGTQIEYVLDGRGRRIAKKVNGVIGRAWLYQDELRPVAELDGSSNVVSVFVYMSRGGPPAYMTRNGNNYRIVNDVLGSPRLVVDTVTGVVAQRIDYDEFGQVLQDSNPGFQPFGFAGGIYDSDTGLLRFGARDYDAVAGRWTAKDPTLFASGTTNLYQYVGNDPVNRYDHDGNKGQTADGTSEFIAEVGTEVVIDVTQTVIKNKLNLEVYKPPSMNEQEQLINMAGDRSCDSVLPFWGAVQSLWQKAIAALTQSDPAPAPPRPTRPPAPPPLPKPDF